MKFLSQSTILLLLLSFVSIELSANQEFPGRDIYLGTEYIEIEDLRKQFDQSIVVDVRSKYEYDTLRILGSKNIPLNSSSFVKNLQQLRDDNKDKKIVFYCNGKTCMKSYKAVTKAKARGIDNVIAYDAGIMDWAKAYPDKAALLDKSPIDPNLLISKAEFEKHLIEPGEFSALVNQGGVTVLDARDRFQRMGMGLFVGIEQKINLDDDSIVPHIKKSIAEKKTILIYDEAGKQVRWLMYRLEAAGAKDYKFMKGGTRAYFKILSDRLKK